MGKTRLLREALAGSDSGFRVVHLRGNEIRAHRPFAPFVSGLAELADHTDAPWVGPVLDLVRTHDGGSVTGDGADVEFRIREALVDGFQHESRHRPTLLVADDLQWFDAASVGTLGRIAELVPGHALSLIVGTRPGTRTVRMERLLAELRRDGAAAIVLEGLTTDDVVTLAEAIIERPLGPRLARSLAALGGSPLLTVEVVAALQADGVLRRLHDGRTELARGERIAGLANVAWAIAQAVEPLGDDTVEVLRIAAVIGTEFAFDDWCLLARRGPADLAQPFQDALAAGVLIEEHPGVVRFRHDIVREVLYAQLPTAVQHGLHREFARILTWSDRPAIDAAPHLVRGATVGDGDAIRWLHEAARQIGPLAPDVALELFDHAVSLVPEGWPDAGPLLADRALTLLWAGRSSEGEAACREVLVAGLDPERTAMLHRMLLRSMLTRGRAADALPILQGAIAATPADNPQQAGFRAALAFTYLNLGDHPRALASADEAIDMAADGADAFTTSEAYHAKAQVLANAGRLVESAEMAAEAFAHLSRAPLPGGTQNLTATAAVTLARIGRGDEAVRMATEGLVGNRARGAAQGVALHHAMIAEIDFLIGDWDGALANLRASEQVAGEMPAWPVASYGTQAMIALHRDDLETASQAVAASYAAARDGHGPLRAYRAEFADALLTEAHGDEEQALGQMVDVWDRVCTRGVGVAYPEVGPTLVRRLVGVGDVDAAKDVTMTVRECASWNVGVDTVEAAALRCEGLVAGDPDVLVAAVDAYERGQLLAESALAAEDAASALGTVGDRDAAVAMLERAEAGHRALGAVRGVRRVAAALRALGVRRGPPQRRGTAAGRGWAALTPKERAVVELVAQRMSNPEIAARLFLSRRTVESHVSRVLAKLGLTSRADIIAAVARNGGTLPT